MADLPSSPSTTKETIVAVPVDSLAEIPLQEFNKEKEAEQCTTSEDEVKNTLHNSGASVFSSTVNLTNTILGAGMLCTPYATAQLGLIFGIMYTFTFF